GGMRELGEEVVLDRPDRVEPEPVGELDLLERLVVGAMLARAVVWLRDLELVEQVELHGRQSWWRTKNGRTAARKPLGLSPMTEAPAPGTSTTVLPGSPRTKRAAASRERIALCAPRTRRVGHRMIRTFSHSRSKSVSRPPLPMRGSNL